jgi:hypothetical protein
METVACPCFEGSADETAVIVIAPDGGTAGAKYSPAVQFAGTEDEEVGQINPSAIDPPATPFTSHVTFDPLADPPFTLARNCWCSPTARDAVVGVTVTPMPELMVTTVVANAVDWMVLVATTKNPFVGGKAAGAVYKPPGVLFTPVVIVPYPAGNGVCPVAAGLQTVGCKLVGEAGKQICQVTVVVEAPVTTALNCTGLPRRMVGLAGNTVIPTGVELPPHPEMTVIKAPNSATAPVLKILRISFILSAFRRTDVVRSPCPDYFL